MYIDQGEAIGDHEGDEPVLLVSCHVRCCVHDLVDRADFRRLAAVQPFLLELFFNLKGMSVTSSNATKIPD